MYFFFVSIYLLFWSICFLSLCLAFATGVFVMVYLEIKWIDSQKFYLFYFYDCSYPTKEKKRKGRLGVIGSLHVE